ncbi:MAG: hypothetical protein KTV68_02730 [Acidimicrobiia bacterium]|nr:hypothetical protein [Acidimicrobiia bacterium]MCY4435140.1 hypothetical protein [bacterium]
MPEDEAVVFVTEEDLRQGTDLALAELQMTFKELEACARDDDFPSHKARLTWFMIAPEIENC